LELLSGIIDIELILGYRYPDTVSHGGGCYCMITFWWSSQ